MKKQEYLKTIKKLKLNKPEEITEELTPEEESFLIHEGMRKACKQTK